jgi:heat shock protein HslJ
MVFFRLLLIIVLLAGGIITISACQSIASPLEDFNWVLMQYNQGSVVKMPLTDTQITARFDSKTKIVNGNGGCNTYSAKYTTERLTLTITSGINATKVSCGGEKDIQEAAFFNLLKNATGFELDHGQLVIESGNARMYFKQTDVPIKTVTHWGE